jgi:hypothetical protein
LSRAKLTNANLNGTLLNDANLNDANLSVANLQSVSNELIAKCSLQPDEIAGLRQFLVEGKINGKAYKGECACFVGTLRKLSPKCRIEADIDSLVERWFLAIKPGDTPENSQVVALTVSWLDSFLLGNTTYKQTALL